MILVGCGYGGRRGRDAAWTNWRSWYARQAAGGRPVIQRREGVHPDCMWQESWRRSVGCPGAFRHGIVLTTTQPAQLRNLSEQWLKFWIDTLIWIFLRIGPGPRRQAASELAQLQVPFRSGRHGQSLSRGRGIGTRGPGEKKLEPPRLYQGPICELNQSLRNRYASGLLRGGRNAGAVPVFFW